MAHEHKQKLLAAGSILCIIAAGIILFLWLKPKDPYKGLETQSYWVMCKDSKCQHTWEMNAKEFLQYQKDHSNPQSPFPTLQVCPKCSKNTGDMAYKCPKCGTIFFDMSIPDPEYSDRCPKCKYSASEERRKAAQASRNK